MTPRQILIEARQLLIDKGWVPYSTLNGTEGPFCMLNALGMVCDDYAERDNAIHALALVIGLENDIIFPWNDSQTSIEPVLAAFDKAIASLEP